MFILILVTHVCCVYGMYMYTQVHTSLHVCGEQKSSLGILLYHSLLSYPETQSLTERGGSLAGSKTSSLSSPSP